MDEKYSVDFNIEKNEPQSADKMPIKRADLTKQKLNDII